VAVETEQGIISSVNMIAQKVGVRIGSVAREAAEIMAHAKTRPPLISLNELGFYAKVVVICQSNFGWRIVAMDSNSMIKRENQKDVIMTGSHGGLVGDRRAVSHPVVAAFYNDAGVGKDKSGISKLAFLQQIGVLSATVEANSARIGDGLDTYQSGVISYVNDLAKSYGIFPGMKASEGAARIIEQKEKEY